MRTRISPRRGAAAALAVLTIAACGSGEEEARTGDAATPTPQQEAPAEPPATPAPDATPAGTPTGPAPLGREELARRVEAICARTATRSARVRARFEAQGDQVDPGRYAFERQRAVDRALSDLRRLRPPPRQTPAFGRFLGAVQAAEALAGRRPGKQTRRAAAEIDASGRTAARQLGADGCRRTPGT